MDEMAGTTTRCFERVVQKNSETEPNDRSCIFIDDAGGGGGETGLCCGGVVAWWQRETERNTQPASRSNIQRACY